MTIFIAFPADLFSWVGGSPACKKEADPRFLEFYEPYMQDESQTQNNEDVQPTACSRLGRYAPLWAGCKSRRGFHLQIGFSATIAPGG
jgi:hypothetical protein